MKAFYVQALDSLITSSIELYKKNGQTIFNRLIQVPEGDRVTSDLIARVKHWGGVMGVEINYRERTRAFHMNIDVHAVRLTLAQAQTLTT